MKNENELRIGNYVLIEEDGIWKEYQVDGVCLATEDKKVEGFSQPFIRFKIGTTVIRFGDDDTEDDYLVRPIPLTPEILERLGFVLNHVDQLSIVLNSIDRHLELNAVVQGNYFFSIDQMEEFGHPSNITLNYIKYLHQLQNLYFALTNEELTLK